MKPFKSALLVIALFSTSSYAQTYAGEHELSISYGIIPAKYDGYNNIDAYGDGTTETATSGNIFVTYKYFFDKQFFIGACAGIQTINGSIYYDGGILEDKFKLINKTVAGEFTFVYANKRYYHFYAFMGFGVV